jgi:hypothetical protein
MGNTQAGLRFKGPAPARLGLLASQCDPLVTLCFESCRGSLASSDMGPTPLLIPLASERSGNTVRRVPGERHSDAGKYPFRLIASAFALALSVPSLDNRPADAFAHSRPARRCRRSFGILDSRREQLCLQSPHAGFFPQIPSLRRNSPYLS